MGQYHLPVNVTKHQFLHPHAFNDALKLREFGPSMNGTMAALSVLLASSNGRGGGDFPDDCVPPELAGLTELIGSWAGDRIVIAGDYDDPGRFFSEAGITESQLRTAVERADAFPGDTDDKIRERLNLYDLCSYGIFQNISGMVIDLFKAAGEPIGEWVDARQRMGV